MLSGDWLNGRGRPYRASSVILQILKAVSELCCMFDRKPLPFKKAKFFLDACAGPHPPGVHVPDGLVHCQIWFLLTGQHLFLPTLMIGRNLTERFNTSQQQILKLPTGHRQIVIWFPCFSVFGVRIDGVSSGFKNGHNRTCPIKTLIQCAAKQHSLKFIVPFRNSSVGIQRRRFFAIFHCRHNPQRQHKVPNLSRFFKQLPPTFYAPRLFEDTLNSSGAPDN